MTMIMIIQACGTVHWREGLLVAGIAIVAGLLLGFLLSYDIVVKVKKTARVLVEEEDELEW